MDNTTLKAMAAKLDVAELAAEGERAPNLKSAHDALAAAKEDAEDDLDDLQEAASALLTALAANGATIAGCSAEIAAVTALLPSDNTAG